MTLQTMVLVVTRALLTVAANLLMRHGLLQAGGVTTGGKGVLALIVRPGLQPHFALGFVCYGLAAAVWFKALSITEVSSTYPMLVGLTFSLVTTGAILNFGESASVPEFVEIIVIPPGVTIISRGWERP